MEEFVNAVADAIAARENAPAVYQEAVRRAETAFADATRKAMSEMFRREKAMTTGPFRDAVLAVLGSRR